jgi:hypothetical protein
MAYDIRFITLPPYNEGLIERYPKLAGNYGLIPQPFIAAIKEKTGLEGYELQDYIDQLILNIFTGWDFAAWVRLQQQIVADAKKRLSRFRTWLVIAMAACIAIPAIVVAIQAATVAVSSVSLQSLSFLSKVKLGIEVFVGSLELTFKSFLTAMHFSTLVGVHKIAFLVSDDYRNVIRQVYGEITKVSEALGYGPYFLTLALQNTRNLVLDVSTSMGMRYDLAEVSWLGTFQEYLKNFAGATYRYANNPEAVFFDLSRWVEKDALDKKGAFIEGLVKTIEKTTEAVTGAIESVVVIRDDLSKLVTDLPDKIKLQIEPAIMPYIEKFDTFIYETYDPYKKELDGIIDTIKGLQSTQRLGMTDLVDRLKRPADYMLEIDGFTNKDRLDQERKFDDLSSRYYKRQITGIGEAVSPINMEMKRISEIVTRPLELMFMGVEEVTAPVPGPIGEIDPSKTWFVGDY